MIIPRGAIAPSAALLEQFERDHDAAAAVLVETCRRAGVDPEEWHKAAARLETAAPEEDGEALAAKAAPPPSPVPWPAAAAAFTLLLTPDDLPSAPFRFEGCTVTDRAKFLARLQADARRGPSGPRSRYGAAQADLVRLREMLTTTA